MIVCPECRSTSWPAAVGCCACGWKAKEPVAGIVEALSERDRNSPIFRPYRSNYDRVAEDDLEESMQDVSLLDRQSERIAKYIGRADGLEICDVGVGQGRLVRKLLGAGVRKVTAVDIAVDYLQVLDDPRVERFIANAENLPFREHFDVIVATDILEHVLNPADFLLSAHDALRVGGRLIVRVPYREDLGQYSRLRGCPYDFVHLRTFDRRSFRDMIRYAGFAVEAIHYDGWLTDRLRPFATPRRLAVRYFNHYLRRLGWSPWAGIRIPNSIGVLLMRPYVMTAMAKRTSSSPAIASP